MDQIDIAAIHAGRAGIGQTELKLNYLRSPESGTEAERLRAASKELETYFIHLLMREMRKTIPPDPLVGGGKAEEIFQDFLDEELAGELARTNQLGLADLIFNDMQKLLKEKSGNADILT
jgi:flagellar protein FlgJ